MIAARIAFSDKTRDADRATYLQAHKDHLREAKIRILHSGPFTDGDVRGGLVVAEVDGLAEMGSFSAADPFVVHRVYGVVHIVEWNITLSSLRP